MILTVHDPSTFGKPTGMATDLSVLADTLIAGGAIQILIGLAILRFALGLTDIVVGLAVVVIAVSLALSKPQSTIAPAEQRNSAESTVSGDRTANIRAALIRRLPQPELDRAALRKSSNTSDPRTTSEALNTMSAQELRAAVAISDLQRGLVWGIKLLIPFVLIDLLIAHLFAVLEWNALPVQSLALPLKLSIFIAIGGWSQLSAWLSTAVSGGLLQ